MSTKSVFIYLFIYLFRLWGRGGAASRAASPLGARLILTVRCLTGSLFFSPVFNSFTFQ